MHKIAQNVTTYFVFLKVKENKILRCKVLWYLDTVSQLQQELNKLLRSSASYGGCQSRSKLWSTAGCPVRDACPPWSAALLCCCRALAPLSDKSHPCGRCALSRTVKATQTLGHTITQAALNELVANGQNKLVTGGRRSQMVMTCDSQVCCWPAAGASPPPPIHSACSPHTPAEGFSSVGLLCAGKKHPEFQAILYQ